MGHEVVQLLLQDETSGTVCVCVHVCVSRCIPAFCVCVCVCVYMCMCVCICCSMTLWPTGSSPWFCPQGWSCPPCCCHTTRAGRGCISVTRQPAPPHNYPPKHYTHDNIVLEAACSGTTGGRGRCE